MTSMRTVASRDSPSRSRRTPVLRPVRPFGTDPVPATAPPRVDLDAQIERAARYGHRLQPPSRTASPVPSPAASPAASPPASSAAPIQLLPDWDDLLAGAGALGGAAALGGGLALSMPALAIGGGLGLLAGGGYLAGKHLLGSRENPDVARLRKVREGVEEDDDLLQNVLDEALNTAGQKGRVKITGGSETPKGDTSVEQDKRGDKHYHVRLDDKVEDETLRSTFLLHELTHVASDQKYSMNTLEGAEFFNQPKPKDESRMRDELDLRMKQGSKQLDQAAGVAETDEMLSPEIREYVQGRLGYASKRTNKEFDTVINELLLYSHLKGLPKKSATVGRVRELARQRYDLRNKKEKVD